MAFTRISTEALSSFLGMSATVPAGCNAIVVQWGAHPAGASTNMGSLALGDWTPTIRSQTSGDGSGKAAMGTATFIGGTTGAQTLTPTWAGSIVGANGGPVFSVTYYTVDTPSDFVRDSVTSSAASGPSTATVSSVATDEVLAFDYRFGGAVPATESGWTSRGTGGTNSAFYRLRTADSPGASTTDATTQDVASSGITSISLKTVAADTTDPDITSTGTGSTNGPFSANVAENSTASFITLTANENVTWSALGGADAALFQKANVTATTVELQPIASFNFESLPHANPFVITITGTDGGGNPRTVTVNASVTNVLEPPTVGTHPTNQTATEPSTATFAVVGNTTTGLTLSYQWQRNPGGVGAWADVSGGTGGTTSSYTTPATTVTGGTANNGDTYRCILTNADGTVTSNAATLTVDPPAADTTNPSLSGTLSASAITTTSYTLTWPAATDNVAVTGYEVSLDAGSNYFPVGNVLTTNITSRSPGTVDACRVRAYDAAGNRSSALSASVPLTDTTLVTGPLENLSGSLLLGTTINYSWYPGGRIGSLTGITPVEGVGTSHATTGTLTIHGLLLGSGIILTCGRNADASTDAVHYEALTVV